MSKWEHQDIRFENKGLDLLRDSVDKPDNVYNILDNAVSFTEGSIQPRKGLQAFSHLFGTSSVPLRINSLSFLKDPVNVKSCTVVGAGDTVNIASTIGTVSNTVVKTGLSANPKTYVCYRPELSSSPACYIGDSMSMNKAFWDTTTVLTGSISNVTVASSGNTFTRGSGSFLVDGFQVGMSITWSGFSNAGNNISTFFITSLSATVMTFANATGLVNESPGAAVSASRNPSWVIRNMGIVPPPIAIPYSEISDQSLVTIEDFSAVADPIVNVKTPVVAAGEVINLSKLTNTALVTTADTYKYAIADYITSGVMSIGRSFATPQDYDTEFSDDSRIEFFLYVSKATDFSEIRIILATTTDGTAVFDKEYYIAKILNSDLSFSASGEVGSGAYLDRAAVWQEIWYKEPWSLENDPQIKEREVNYEVDRIMREPWTYQGNTYAQPGWCVVSIKRNEFQKVGTSGLRGWDTIYGIRIEIVATSDSSVFGVSQVTISPSGGLDCTNGIPYKWIYSYWNDAHGSESNPSPEQFEGAYIVGRHMPLSLVPSTDPQVTHVKIYRYGGYLGAYHLVDSIKLGTATMAPYYQCSITAISDTTPISITYSPAKSMDWGDQILITGTTGGATALDGIWQVIPGSTTSAYLIGSIAIGAFTNNGTIKTIKYVDSVPDEAIAFRQEPRFDLDVPITTIQKRTNLVKYSEELSNSSWTKGNLLVYDRAANSPDGGSMASIIAMSSVSPVALSALSQSITTPVAGIHTISFYVRRNLGTGILQISTAVDVAHYANGPWEIVNTMNYPDQRWDRIKYSKYLSAGTHVIGLSIIPVDAGAATIYDSYQIWGFQVEYGAYMNDYIKTGGQVESVIDGSKKGSSLPVIFGPFLGKYIFGLGCSEQPGMLYWCNEQQPDSWSPLNSIEITSPTDPLQNGCVFDGKVYVFSKEAMFVVYPSMTGGNTFQVLPTSCNFGLWSRYALAVGSKMWFLSGAGIMETVGGEAVNISQNSLVRTLFEGKQVGDYYPLNWEVVLATDYNFNLTYVEPYLYFIYKDTSDTNTTNTHMSVLAYHTIMQRWHSIKFPTGVIPTVSYGIKQLEGSSSGFETYFGSIAGKIYWYTGTSDLVTSGGSYSSITMTVATPDAAQGSSRMEKMYGDLCLDMDGGGITVTATPYINFGNEVCEAVAIATTVGRKLYVIPIRRLGRSGIYEAPISKTISLKLESSATTSYPIYYGLDLTYSMQGDEIKGRIMDWDDCGDPRQKYIWGAALDIDTYGATLYFDLYADGVYITGVPIPGVIGRHKVEVSWPVFQASFVRLVSASQIGYLLYGDPAWYFHAEAAHTKNWTTYWQDLAEGTDSYVFGVDIEGDTHGISKSIIVEVDGGTVVCTKNVILDGHTKVRITFPPVKANTARIRSTDDVSGFLYKEKWISSPEPPLIEDWDTNYDNDGSLDDKWITGLYLECDTSGVTKSINVLVDGVSIGNYSFSSNGRGPVKISIGPVRGVTMKFTSTSISGRLYNYRWIHEPEPVQLTNMATNWTNMEWPYEKLVKGVSIEADTGGLFKTVRVAINGLDTNVVGDIITLNSDGRKLTMHELPNVLAETVRLVSSDSNIGRLYGVKWVYDREPISMSSWETQESTFEKRAYSSIKDMYVSLRSSVPVNVSVFADGNLESYSIPSTGGERRKVRVTMKSTKGRNWKFKFSSVEPFKIYVSDCVVHVKAWGESGDYSPYVLPFPGGE